ncbi:MAG: SGNH/GDSL hydrolase family protein [Pseudomonadota bacterium]
MDAKLREPTGLVRRLLAGLPPWAGNLGALALSGFICLMLLEHVVFRFILKPDDVLPNVTINKVVRYYPGTHATFRHPDGTSTRATINEDGWNSVKARYAIERRKGVYRIAVIGDSYVHAKFVNPREGFPAVLERKLNARGVKSEVYRFGMDGAPLSQYLHMLRHEVLRFKPDVVIVPLIHNDFDESYRFLRTRYASSFMKLKRDDEGSVVEIPPADFKPGLSDVLRNLRTFRYLYYQTGLYLTMKDVISRFYWGGNERYQPEFISSGVDIRKIADHRKNRFYARYVLREMKALAHAHGVKLVFVMDAVREAIYENIAPQKYEVGRLNLIAADLTRQMDLPFINLQATFARDYARHGKRFEFPYDWHWNRRANRLVAGALTTLLISDPRLLKPEAPKQASMAQPPSR